MSMKGSLEQLKAALDSTGLTYRYNVFPLDDGAPACPYLTAMVTSGEGFNADNINYFDTMSINVILFTDHKDPGSEDKVRDALKSLKLTYTWTESYAEDERIYTITYNIRMNA